jgi:hypothetical protein
MSRSSIDDGTICVITKGNHVWGRPRRLTDEYTLGLLILQECALCQLQALRDPNTVDSPAASTKAGGFGL